MIDKIKTSVGYTVYKMNYEDYKFLQQKGLLGGVCDYCNERITNTTSYLIPVLNNYVYCEKCYKEWIERAVYCQEDYDFEQAQLKTWDTILNGIYIRKEHDELIKIIRKSVFNSISDAVCPYCLKRISTSDIIEDIKQKDELQLGFLQEEGSTFIKNIECPHCNEKFNLMMSYLFYSEKGED